MIAGATIGFGGDRLALYLLQERRNETVEAQPARELISEKFYDQVLELTAISLRGRSRRSVLHLFVRLPNDRTENRTDAYTRFRELLEAEFKLSDQPCAVIKHEGKSGEHFHFVYSLIKQDGNLINLSHDFARREKVCRIVEYEFGFPIIAGRHNRAVIHQLKAEGRHDVVQAMRSAHLDSIYRPSALTTQLERRREIETGIRKSDVARIFFDTWINSKGRKEFIEKLTAENLKLEKTKFGLALLDQSGTWHSIAKLVRISNKLGSAQRMEYNQIAANLDSASHNNWKGGKGNEVHFSQAGKIKPVARRLTLSPSVHHLSSELPPKDYPSASPDIRAKLLATELAQYAADLNGLTTRNKSSEARSTLPKFFANGRCEPQFDINIEDVDSDEFDRLETPASTTDSEDDSDKPSMPHY